VTCCSAFTSLSCEECQTWSRVFGPPRTMSTVCLDQLWCALHLISCGAQCACQPAKKLRKLHVTKSTAMQSLYFQIAACENRHAKNSMRNAHYLQQAQPLNTATACTLASMELLTCIERPAALAARVLPLPQEWPQKQLSTKHAHFAIKASTHRRRENTQCVCSAPAHCCSPHAATWAAALRCCGAGRGSVVAAVGPAPLSL